MDPEESVSDVASQAGDEPDDDGWEEAAGVRRTLYLSAELSRALAIAAQEQGVTVNDLLVLLITEGLQRRSTTQDAREEV